MKPNAPSVSWRNKSQVSRLFGGFLGLAAGGMVAVAVHAANPMVVSGSDFLGAAVTAVLTERGTEYEQKVKIKFSGSRLAQDELVGGVADLAVLIDDPSAAPLPVGFKSVPIGFLTALVVVNQRISIEQLDFPALRRIFGSESGVGNSRWADLGAAGDWANVPVTAHIVTAATGFSQELFMHTVLTTPTLRLSVRRHATVESLLAALQKDDGGVGIVPWLPESAVGIKTLLLAEGEGAVAFGASPENLSAGDYAIRQRLSLVFPEAKAAELFPWLRYWFGAEMTEALRKDGVVPLPVNQRNQQVFDLEVLQ